jgi:hypothetical protein
VEPYRDGTRALVMSDDAAGALQPIQPIYQDIEFDGDTLPSAIVEGDGVLVPVRKICEALGLDTRYQLQRLREHEVLLVGLREIRIPIEGRLRVVAAIHHRYIAFWLATVTPHQVSDQMRPKLVRYQRELVDILAAIYGPHLSPNMPLASDPTISDLSRQMAELLLEFRLARTAYLEHQREITDHEQRIEDLESIVESMQRQLATYVPITPAQQEFIARSIKQLARRYQKKTGKDLFGQLFAEFCRTLGTPRYDELPASKYEAALEWIEARARQLLPDDPDAVPPMQQRLL